MKAHNHKKPFKKEIKNLKSSRLESGNLTQVEFEKVNSNFYLQNFTYKLYHIIYMILYMTYYIPPGRPCLSPNIGRGPIVGQPLESEKT